VVQSIQPGQQIIKIIHDELVTLLGSSNAGLALSGNPSCLILAGLHGSGKTTTSAKLARWLQKQARQTLLVAADVYRPAAMEQLETLGKQIEVPVFALKGEKDVLQIARQALDFARQNHRDTLIFDTAGRLQIDQPLVQELARLRDLIQPREILLVLDAATARRRSTWPRTLTRRCKSPGILTKLDATREAARRWSLKAVTGKPIKFMGTGRSWTNSSRFTRRGWPRAFWAWATWSAWWSGRVEAVDLDDAKRMEEKMRKGQFSLEDFLEQLRAMKSSARWKAWWACCRAGGGHQARGHEQTGKGIQADGGDYLRDDVAGTARAANPQCQAPDAHCQGQRRAGVRSVNNLLNKFNQMQQMMKKMGKFQKMMGGWEECRA